MAKNVMKNGNRDNTQIAVDTMNIYNVKQVSNAVNALKNIALTQINKKFDESADIVDACYDAFFKDIEDKIITNDLVEMGYWLTDIYERNGFYDKACKIAESLVNIYFAQCKKTNNIYSINIVLFLQRLIGCSYTIAIAQPSCRREKRNCLDRASELFEKIQTFIERSVNLEFCPGKDKHMLLGLYHSDLGALYLNEGDYYNGIDDIKRDSFYDKAAEEYEKSLTERYKYYKFVKNSESYEKQEALNTIARSESHIGALCYRNTDYENCIIHHRKALAIFTRLKDEERKHRTYDYVTGGYINMWKKDINKFNIHDFIQCCRFLDRMCSYYSKGNSRYDTAVDRMKEINELLDFICIDGIKKINSKYINKERELQ